MRDVLCCIFLPFTVRRQEAGAGEGRGYRHHRCCDVQMCPGAVQHPPCRMHRGAHALFLLFPFNPSPTLCVTVCLRHMCARSRHAPVTHHHGSSLLEESGSQCCFFPSFSACFCERELIFPVLGLTRTHAHTRRNVLLLPSRWQAHVTHVNLHPCQICAQSSVN